MSILKTIFRLFKTSGIYNSYTNEQQGAIDEICDIHMSNTNYDETTFGRLQHLEMKVSRRVLSSSIDIYTIMNLLNCHHIQPGQLELVNVMEDIEDESDRIDFLNLFVEKCDILQKSDTHQLQFFPEKAIVYLSDENKDIVNQFKL